MRVPVPRPTNWKVGTAAFVFALIIAFIGFVVVHMVWESAWPLVLLSAVLFAILSQQPNPLAVLGTSLYATALVVITAPLVYMLALLLQPAGPDGGALWIADFLYTAIFRGSAAVVGAAFLAGFGYLINKRATEGGEAATDA